jgi:hypothetical protein
MPVMGKKKDLTAQINPYDWARKGEYWKELLDSIQPTVERAKPSGAEISRENWDAPDLKMQWSSDGIGRAIQVLISDSSGRVKLVVNGSAWMDSGRERHWKMEELKTIGIHRDPQKLNLSTLYQQLSELKKIVAAWTEKDLNRADPLPCRSCN